MTTAPARIPLIFGVTGHRDIPVEDLGALEGQIAALFQDYRARYPSTPLRLLTSLAEGGDRVATKAALREKIEVVPILPMPQAEYEKDFAHSSSLDEFRGLLNQAAPPVIPPSDNHALTSSLQSGDAREVLYERAGVYVALHCHVLIALWDGYERTEDGGPLKPAGTGAIVGFRRNGVLPNGRPLPAFCRTDMTMLDATELGPDLQFLTRRTANKRAPVRDAAVPGSNGTGDPERATPDEVFAYLNTFNRDVHKNGTFLAEKIATSASYALPNPSSEGEHEIAAKIHSGLDTLLSQFATADVLALLFRDRVQWTLIALSLLAIATFLAFEVFAHLRLTWDVLLAYLGLLAIAWGIYLWAKKRDWQTKYLDYRALAEALRVQFFWRLSGLSLNAADFYLRRQTSDLVWIRYAARGCNVGVVPETTADAIAWVKRKWIENQAGWFQGRVRDEQRKLQGWNRCLNLAYFMGIVLAGVIFVAFYWGYLTEGIGLHVAIVVMGLAPAIAAVVGFFIGRRAYEAHIKQYRRMADLFTRADSILADVLEISEQQKIIRQIGQDALAENGDWVITHRERRVTPITG